MDARLPVLGAAAYAVVDSDLLPQLLEYRWRAVRSGSGHLEVVAYVAGHTVRLHRYIWGLTHDDAIPQGIEVDHVNRDSLDNRRANLRLASAAQNLANRRTGVAKTSRYRGVSRRRNRWYAQIQYVGRSFNLGTYPTPEAAARAYDAAARRYYGEFAETNFKE